MKVRSPIRRSNRDATAREEREGVSTDERTAGEGAEGSSGEPPIDARTPRVGEKPTFATGLPAVKKAIRLAVREMGIGRSLKTLGDVNQREGFDCPGCAWPDPEGHRAMAEFCENGAKAVASEAMLARAGPEFFAAHSIQELEAKPDVWMDKAGRITHPMVLREGASHYVPILWEEAFALIARELNSLPTPNAATFYTSGRTSNEAAFLYQLFVRQFGTNNLPDCSNMCHESSGDALMESIGVGKGTVTIEDFGKADSIWIIGQNPGTNHPRMLSSLLAAARNGCAIVGVNPLREVGLQRFAHPQEVLGLLGRSTALESLHAPVRINGDIAFFKGVMKEMLEAEERGESVIDRAFVDGRTEGFEAFAADIRGESWDVILEQSGVSREVIREAARVAMKSQRMIVCWAMGITQHASAVGNIQTIANFALLRGQIGRPGAGLCPVRGHSNVQGDRTMGISERMPRWFLEKLGVEFGFLPPEGQGLDVVESIRAMQEGKVRVFIGMGGNLLGAAPDTHYTAAAMRRCSLTVQVSTKLNRGHLVTGKVGLILPCLGRTEIDRAAGSESTKAHGRDARATDRFVTVEDSMGKVHASRGSLQPASEQLMSEVGIVCALARAVLGERSSVEWERLAADYDLIRERIGRVVPGFEKYNERVREKGGFYVPNGPRDGVFTTPSGKAKFVVHPIPRWKLEPEQLLLMTIRTHDQFNTTVYGEDDRYRGITGGRRVIFMHREDIALRGLRAGDRVDVTSWFGEHGRERRVAKAFMVVEYEIPPKCAAGYFPEMNVLVPIGSVAAGSNQPASKSMVVTVAKSGSVAEQR
jgi:molybdopterin-dependent oxidoreductase alpha subunit